MDTGLRTESILPGLSKDYTNPPAIPGISLFHW